MECKTCKWNLHLSGACSNTLLCADYSQWQPRESGPTGRAASEQVGGEHYKDMAIQPSEFIQRNGLNWCEGNVVKYVCRHRAKNGKQDIEKAIHYLRLLLEWEYE